MKIIEDNIETLFFISEEHSVKRLEVYGSVLTVNFNKKSDIDFLVKFKEISIASYSKNYFLYHEKLELLFDRKVDLSIVEDDENRLFLDSLTPKRKIIYEDLSS